MTDTLTALTAAVLLALTVPGQAATPQSNLRAIEALAARQQRSIERAAVPAAHIAPKPQQKPDTTLQMTPAEIRYEESRDWHLIRKPWRDAIRVRGGWLVHRTSDYTGFYRPLTTEQARRLHSR